MKYEIAHSWLVEVWLECHTYRKNNKSICHKTIVYSYNKTITTPFLVLNKYYLQIDVGGGEQLLCVIQFEVDRYLLGYNM